MQLNELLPRLSGVRRGRDGYAAKCPAHDDKVSSLSVGETEGRILINCFAGCTGDQVIRALGLEWRDLFDKQIRKPSSNYLGAHKSAPSVRVGDVSIALHGVPRVHAVYPYHDSEGKLLYETVRYYPKDFRVRRTDETGKVHWNLDGITRVPYRLPQLLKAVNEGGDIFLCEGEKDVDSVRELGLNATSFKNWLPEFNEYIRGRHIVILQDHDLPGVKQAADVARKLLKAAASVKVVDVFAHQELPDKHGPDISDLIRECVQEHGQSNEEIAEQISLIAEKTERWAEPAVRGTQTAFKLEGCNQWLDMSSKQRNAKMLFGEFWFEGEICILFADTNVGKSILAMQIGDAISRGVSVGDLKNEAPAQKVVYFDFELTAKQFEARFAEAVPGKEVYSNHYKFHPNMYRAELDPAITDLGGFTNFEDFLNFSLNEAIVSTGAEVLIVDNLTYLRDETENARNALPLMKYLKELKAKHNLSMLVLAHTPKRDASRPLGRNDLQGSKMLINFCDSSFAIGESAAEVGLRYLKQIKSRNSAIIYHQDNVLLSRIVKEVNFLKFTFEGTAHELEHLRKRETDDRKGNIAKAAELRGRGHTLSSIAKILKVSEMTVHRYLKVSPAISTITTES